MLYKDPSAPLPARVTDLLTRMTRALCVLVACGLAIPASARAQERSRPGAGSVLDVASIDRAAALRIRAEARALLADSFRWVGEEPAQVGQ